MSLLHKTDEIQQAASILDGLTDIIARKVAGYSSRSLFPSFLRDRAASSAPGFSTPEFDSLETTQTGC